MSLQMMPAITPGRVVNHRVPSDLNNPQETSVFRPLEPISLIGKSR